MHKLARIAFLAALFAAIVSLPTLNAQEDNESAGDEAKQESKVVETKVEVDSSLDLDAESAIASEQPKLSFLFSGGNPGSIEELKLMEAQFDKLTKKLFPATVNIQVGPSQGSGVVVSSDGYILTAAHVIQKPGQVAFVYFPDRKKRYIADTLGVNSGAIDSGMLKLRNPDGESFPTIDLGISDKLKLGQWVMAVGHPGGFDIKRGLVTRVGRVVSATEGVIRTDCTLVGGDSGGPLIDMNGDLIGIHSRIGGSLIDNLHVPVDQFSSNWDKLAKGLLLHERPNLGIDIVDDTNEVEAVVEGRSGDKAGLRTGDKIIKIDGFEVADKADIGVALKGILPRQKLNMVVLRKDKKVEIKLTVGVARR